MKQTVAAIYARYSSHAQDGGTSIEVQIEACRKALAGLGVREYVDRARTGRSMAGREALLQLLDDAEAGQINRVCIYKYDRLGRNLAETSAIIAQLEDCGVEVVSVTEGKDQLARGVQLVVAEHYSRALAERTRDGLLQRFKQGAWTGGPPPYGYCTVDDNGVKRLCINETEAAVVRNLFDEYLAGKGYKILAQGLHRRGVPTRLGGLWTHTSVRTILRNEVYIGKVYFNRRLFKLNRKTGRRVPQWKSADQVVSNQDENLRIISDEQFEQARKRMKTRARRKRGPRSSVTMRPFTGLITCENGHRCYVRQSRNAKGNYYYYACAVRQRAIRDECDNLASLREDLLIRDITEAFKHVFDDAESIIAEATAEAQELMRSNRQESVRIKGQLAEIDKEIAGLTRLLVDPDMDALAKKAIMRQVGELETRRESLHAAMAEMADDAGETTERLAAEVRRAFDEARDSFNGILTPLQMHEFAEEVIGPMTLLRDGRVISADGRVVSGGPAGPR